MKSHYDKKTFTYTKPDGSSWVAMPWRFYDPGLRMRPATTPEEFYRELMRERLRDAGRPLHRSLGL